MTHIEIKIPEKGIDLNQILTNMISNTKCNKSEINETNNFSAECISVRKLLRTSIISTFKNNLTLEPYFDMNASTLFDALNYGSNNKEIDRIRSFNDKFIQRVLKDRLPCFTPNGLFVTQRIAFELILPSQLICIGIEKKDNAHITNFDSLYIELGRIKNVACCLISETRDGYYLFIPAKVEFEDYKENYFRCLQLVFKEIKIIIDPSWHDITKTLLFHYDINDYIAENAIEFQWNLSKKILLDIISGQI